MPTTSGRVHWRNVEMVANSSIVSRALPLKFKGFYVAGTGK